MSVHTKAPLRKVVNRHQDFRSTEDFPHGWIVESLECGHEHHEAILPDMPAVMDDGGDRLRPFPHSHNAERRRCDDCARAQKKAKRAHPPAEGHP